MVIHYQYLKDYRLYMCYHVISERKVLYGLFISVKEFKKNLIFAHGLGPITLFSSPFNP